MPGPTACPADPAWAALADQLEKARRSVVAEIRSYPAPIAACDQQFNHLLEQRDRIAAELSRATAVARDAADREEVIALLNFVDAAECLDRQLKARLVPLLRGRLDRAGEAG